MSEKIKVKVKCHHSGIFKTDGGVLNYVDGKVEVVEVDSVTIFEDVLIYLLEKQVKNIGKMWYKLPFEELSDRMPLFKNVDANKKKLVAKGRWMGEIDIFFEKADADSLEGTLPAEKVIEDAKLVLKDNVSEDEGSDGQKSDAGLSESSDSEGEDDIRENDAEIVEEDIQVFNNENYEEQILDEDEEYPATNDESGDEEQQAESDFKKNIIKYILKTRRNVVYSRWEKKKLEAKCKGKGCHWEIYCSVENPIGKWMVKRYHNEHLCHPTGRCELIKTPIIADLFLEDIRRDPEMSGPEIKDEMKRRYNIIISPNQTKVARRRIFDRLQAECDEQFSRLRDYELQLCKTNDGTTVEINTTTRDDGSEAFSQMYIFFEALRSAWKQNCRPIIGLDATFLKHSMKGQMLTAVGRDPNNQIFPIAWAVVDCENNPNWEWFVRKLKEDLGLGLGENITLISDMHKGLIHGVATELPMAEHRACARHIYSNLKKFHKENMLKPLF
ncbi:PREDICTED: uncharacterized protein LOC104714967 [Camelina sativa]|uniref:Uncharacterized protein LOC104714967 n=1 Tax=Camelina sativa TaxID=90675 RepID=A0ABM0TSS6_CAMSA|nr:PREDICTED: uncharacterized protein LOC104714967 [Camelina sativa]